MSGKNDKRAFSESIVTEQTSLRRRCAPTGGEGLGL